MMYLSLRKTAARAEVSFETARRWAHAGLGYRVGGRWRIDPIKLDRHLHGLPLNRIPNQELAVLLRQAADTIEGDAIDGAKPVALVIGEINAWMRGGEIREEAATTKTPEREATNARPGGVAS